MKLFLKEKLQNCKSRKHAALLIAEKPNSRKKQTEHLEQYSVCHDAYRKTLRKNQNMVIKSKLARHNKVTKVTKLLNESHVSYKARH